MVDYKPLPAIPPPNINLTTLSIDARGHRSRLLYHFLAETHDPEIDSKREAWVCVFEDVLDEMGSCLHKGGWLAEFRKTREARRRLERQKERQQLDAVKPKKLVKTQSGSGDTTHLSRVDTPLEKRLLLSVAPLGSRIPLPTEDSGFAFVHDIIRVGCTFVPENGGGKLLSFFHNKPN
jgi:1-phosphatidylinositol-3-phosphate 5-kinase